jgi:NADH-quinone oxidoreductase subunit H
MLPLALVNLLVAGIWRFLSPGISRWLVCALLVVLAYVLLGRSFTPAQVGPRKYRYAS